MANQPQRSFAGGELSPALYARTDLQKYSTGLRTLRNFLVMRHGGIANRPGTMLCAAAKDSTQVERLAKFVFNAAQTYLLEFGNQTLRFTQNGGQVITSGVTAWATATDYTLATLRSQGGVTYYCTLAHTSGATTQPGIGANWGTYWYALTGTIYEIPTPYLAADLSTLQMVQSADVVTIVHQNYAPRELKRTGNTSWTLTPIVLAPTIGAVANLSASGGSAGAAYFWAVTANSAASGDEGLAVIYTSINKVPSTGTPTTLAWDPLGGALDYNVYRSSDGVTYGLLGPASGLPKAKTSTTWGTATATATTSTPSPYVASASQARITPVAAITDKAYDGVYTIQGLLTLSVTGGTPGFCRGRLRVYYKRGAETRVDAGVLTDIITLTGVGSTSAFFSGSVTVPDNGYTALVIDLVPEAAGAGTGATVVCGIDETTAPYNQAAWSVIATGFIDTGLAPDYQSAPPTQPTLFQSAGTYPSAVCYYQQRRGFAGSSNEPSKVQFSRSAVFSSFTKSTPIQDDDPVTFSLVSQQVNTVVNLVDVGELVIFTSGGEWVVGRADTDVLTPSNINPRQQMYFGAAPLRPQIIGNTMLFVQARGSLVRDLTVDVYKRYSSNDLTLLANHLVDGFTIVDWDYAQTPNSVVWAVRNDGVLLGLTYIKDQEVWGWHRHDTDGFIENVCVAPEGNEDAVYLLVRRTINGATVRYVERMASRAITALTDVTSLHFMDCGLSYDGRNTGVETMTLSGGVLWTQAEQTTLTRSVGGFVAGDVGSRVDLTALDGTTLRCTIEGYTSTFVVTVRVNRTVPADLRTTATLRWAKAAKTFTGLSHLEGKAVAVYADGLVAASPNNSAYPVITVSGGSITLDQPYVVVRVGLPYLSDMETLDIDTAQGKSLKEGYQRIGVVGLMIDHSRGIFAGMAIPTGTDPLAGLLEYKARDTEFYDSPVNMISDYVEVGIDSNWNSNGRIAVRQVDPLPLTILSAIPQGNLPSGG